MMEIDHKKISVVRWTIDNFFDHVNNRTEHLDSKKFELDGLNAKFFVRLPLRWRFESLELLFARC
jgi:hypothetical protein